ncbi:MAG: DUF1269 domain-containing protein [Chloroflexi bacterium]|jgi:uncharacterized membrane protein|nr:DUF1269 domain-containing protein [Chloroflexota bacterium]
MSKQEKTNHEMIVVSFADENMADEVLDTIKKMEDKAVVDLKSGAVVKRDASGKVTIKETSDFDAKQGAIGGAIAGSVLSLLGGSLIKGAILGAAGGAIAGKVIDLGLDDDFLKEIGENLESASSAVVALVDFDQVDQAMEELDQFSGGTILHHTLSDEVYEKLSEVVED